MRVPAPARIGIGAIFAGICMLVAYYQWLGDPDSWYDPFFDLWVLSTAFIAVGLVLVIRSAIQSVGEDEPGECLPQFASHKWSSRAKLERRERPRRLFTSFLGMGHSSNIPAVGFFYALTLVTVFSMCVLQSNSCVPIGLTVHLLSERQDRRILASAPPLLRIDVKKRWYWNSTRISPKDLPSLLEAERRQRPEVIVFLDGDEDLDLREIVRAVDLIRGEQGQVFLLGEEPISTESALPGKRR
jgi:biopolymer transport protein ExbD